MRLNGYSAKFYPEREIKSDADYCIMRVRKTTSLDLRLISLTVLQFLQSNLRPYGFRMLSSPDAF
jgi:hypothetical protein